MEQPHVTMSYLWPPKLPCWFTLWIHSLLRTVQHWRRNKSYTAVGCLLLRGTSDLRPLQPDTNDASWKFDRLGQCVFPGNGAVLEALTAANLGIGAVRICPVLGFTSSALSSRAKPWAYYIVLLQKMWTLLCKAAWGWGSVGATWLMLTWAMPESLSDRDLHSLKGTQRLTS